MTNHELKIKKEFRDLIPPLSEHEKEGLEEDIKHYGCYCPIVTWNGFIIDGHHRYEICMRHRLSFRVEEKEFDSQNDAEIWIIKNQFARRNLTDFVRGELVLDLKPRLRKRAEENSASNNRYTQAAEKEPINESQSFATRRKKTKKERDEDCVNAQIGDIANISREQVRKIEKLKETCSEEEVAKLRSGKITVNKKFTEKKKEKHQQTLKNTEFPKGKYRVIYADPPWEYAPSKGPGGGDAEDEYPTMSFDSICELPINQISDENAVLFLWVTTPLIQKGLNVMKAWGFEYKTIYTWDKVRSFFGHYSAVAQEFLLLGTRGSCLPDCNTLPHSVVRIQRGKHSEKPEEFRQIIETLYKYGNKVELFARKKTEGWEVYGNEI